MLICGICEYFDECYGMRMPVNVFVEYSEYRNQPEVICKRRADREYLRKLMNIQYSEE